MIQLKKAGILLFLGIIIIFVQKYEWNQKISQAPDVAGQAQIVRIVDGDTIIVRLDEEERVRIIGINAPESVKPNSPVECFGIEASDYMKSLLQPGDTVSIETDPTQDTRDRNGRLLAHIFLNDINLAQKMITDGYGYEYTYREPYIYQLDYRAAEKDARNNNRGLWSPETCNGKK